MKDSKFIIDSYGIDKIDDVWISGFIHISLPNGGQVETPEFRIYFKNNDLLYQWIEYMGEDVVLPEIMKGLR